MYPHFGRIHSEMGKENKLTFRNYIIYLNIYNKPPPPKGWNEPKTICLSMYLHFGRIHSEIGKENKLTFRNYIIYLNIYNKNPPKRMKWDENKTLHWIMRWGWMRWKRNLTFNNDDGKKLYTENYLHKNKLKNFKKFNYYYPPSPSFSFSSSLSENRNKITKKMYYPWIHYAVQNWLSLNKIALQ